jgi:16S rRNA (cytidine1402-2'-O)-methyltransferase
MLECAIYLVPTPIGNMEDITLRAIRVLQEADIIACEDTRHSGQLLKALKIIPKAPLQSYHDHNEEQKANVLVEQVLNGKSLALISDAGTPCISDPGYRLVNAAIERNVKIVSLPGATAFVPALVSSGFAVNNFTFFGFLPQKKGRATFLRNVLECRTTAIVYESSHRIMKLISELSELAPERRICICREISKVYEEIIHCTASEAQHIKLSEKGEFVVVIEGNQS